MVFLKKPFFLLFFLFFSFAKTNFTCGGELNAILHTEKVKDPHSPPWLSALAGNCPPPFPYVLAWQTRRTAAVAEAAAAAAAAVAASEVAAAAAAGTTEWAA